MGSEEGEELALLDGLDPRERAGFAEDEGALVVAFLLLLFTPVELTGSVVVRLPVVDVVTGSGRNLLLRRMLGPGRVLEAADAGLFMSQRNRRLPHEKMLCFRAEMPRIVR